jgi:hypothetical protein
VADAELTLGLATCASWADVGRNNLIESETKPTSEPEATPG